MYPPQKPVKPASSGSSSSFFTCGIIAVLLSVVAIGAMGAIFSTVGGFSFDFNFGGYSFNYRGEVAEKHESGDIPDTVSLIEIENRFGNVEIVSTDEQATWKWDPKVWADTQEDADRLIAELKMKVETGEDKHVFKIVMPESDPAFNGVKSNLVLRVPANIKTKLINAHGDIDVQNIDGDVELNNSHGNIEVINLTGQLNVKNRHGEFLANQIAGGVVDLNHASGTLSGVDGDLEITNSHGALNIKGLTGIVIGKNSHGSTKIQTTGDEVEFRSSHGDIKLTIENDSFRLIDLQADHSSIEVFIPASVTPNVEIDTSHGGKNSDVVSDENSSQTVKLKTSHGDVTLLKQGSVLVSKK